MSTGMSRSACVMVAYVMETVGIGWELAQHYVATRRHCIALNKGFQYQLKEYDMICANKRKQLSQQNAPGQNDQISHGTKRLREREDMDLDDG